MQSKLRNNNIDLIALLRFKIDMHNIKFWDPKIIGKNTGFFQNRFSMTGGGCRTLQTCPEIIFFYIDAFPKRIRINFSNWVLYNIHPWSFPSISTYSFEGMNCTVIQFIFCPVPVNILIKFKLPAVSGWNKEDNKLQNKNVFWV